MGKRKTISRRSFGYALLKLYVRFWLKRYYAITIRGKEKIPSKGTFILAANHQNALIDALAILTSQPWQPVFLARSDIFANKTVNKILTFLKILPIYRMRDGYDQLANNDEVFGEVYNVLDQYAPLGIMPEGNHDNRKLLRPMKKGIARIAFSYRHNQPNNRKEIEIIPIGLNYTDHHKEGSKLLCKFGDPITLAKYDALYHERPPKAYKQFLGDLHASIRSLITHVENMDCYETCSDTADMYASLLFSQNTPHEEIVMHQQETINHLQLLFENDKKQFEDVRETSASIVDHLKGAKCSVHDLSLWKLAKGHAFNKLTIWGMLFVTFPLFLYGFIQNLLPRFIVKKIRGLFKDPQFESTALFAASIFVFPLIHLLQSIIVGLITWSITIALLYGATLLPFYFIEKAWRTTWEKIHKAAALSRVKEDLIPLLKKLRKKLNMNTLDL